MRLTASRRYSARTDEPTEWGSQLLARQAALVAASGSKLGLLAYGGTGEPGAYLAQASVCTQLTRVLELAGLSDDLRARSLRGWAGRRLYTAGTPVEEVARRLGCRSLDAAAAEVGLQWSD